VKHVIVWEDSDQVHHEAGTSVKKRFKKRKGKGKEKGKTKGGWCCPLAEDGDSSGEPRQRGSRMGATLWVDVPGGKSDWRGKQLKKSVPGHPN
jgi:hypothetical protein